MAVTQAGAALTVAEQQASSRLGLLYAALALRLWSAYAKSDDIDASAARVFELLIPQILKGRRQNAAQARRYYQTFRITETPEKAIWTPPAELVDLERTILDTSLRVTGPVRFKKSIARISGADLTQEVERALTQSILKDAGKSMAAAVTRHVNDGSRQEVLANTKLDPVALGFMRVTKSARPCYFCSMLASRGPVYGQESFSSSDPRFIGDGVAKAHDNCSCVLEPVFSRATNLPDTSRQAAEVWGSSTKGKSGQAAINAFRTAWDNR